MDGITLKTRTETRTIGLNWGNGDFDGLAWVWAFWVDSDPFGDGKHAPDPLAHGTPQSGTMTHERFNDLGRAFRSSSDCDRMDWFS